MAFRAPGRSRASLGGRAFPTSVATGHGGSGSGGPGTVTPPPSSGSDASGAGLDETDPFLLSWGSSVNVNEDLRRTVQTETTELESAIASLQSNIGGEERTATQLSKDLHHAESEMRNLRRGAADDVDTARMNEDLRTRLADTLRIDLTAKMLAMTANADEKDESATAVSATAVSAMDTSSDDPVANAEGCTADTEQTRSHNASRSQLASDANAAPKSFDKYIPEMFTKVRTLSKWMNETATHIRITQEEAATTEAQVLEMQTRIVKKDLRGALEASKEELEACRRELDAEKGRMTSIKEAVQRSRSRGGHCAQQIADLSRKLTQQKSLDASKEAELEEAVSKRNEEVAELKKTRLLPLEQKLESISTQLDTLSEQHDKFNELRGRAKEKTREVEKAKEETAVLRIRCDEITAQLKTANEELAAATATRDRLKEEEAKIDALKRRNDEEVMKTVEPKEKEHSELLKRKEKLASEITKLHESAAAFEEENKMQIREQEAILEKLQNEMKEAKSKLEAVRVERAKIDAERESKESAAKDEVKAYEELRDKFKAAAEAEQERARELREKRERETQERLAAMRADNEEKKRELDLKLEIHKRGTKMMKLIDEVEKRLKNTPVEVGENTADIFADLQSEVDEFLRGNGGDKVNVAEELLGGINGDNMVEGDEQLRGNRGDEMDVAVDEVLGGDNGEKMDVADDLSASSSEADSI